MMFVHELTLRRQPESFESVVPLTARSQNYTILFIFRNKSYGAYRDNSARSVSLNREEENQKIYKNFDWFLGLIKT